MSAPKKRRRRRKPQPTRPCDDCGGPTDVLLVYAPLGTTAVRCANCTPPFAPPLYGDDQKPADRPTAPVQATFLVSA